MTIQEAYKNLLTGLKTVYDEREATNISHWVMEHLTGLSKLDCIVYKDQALDERHINQLKVYTTALLDNKPVQYVLHEAWFAGMQLFVDENVLIPRPETEELVEWIVESTMNEVLSIKDQAGARSFAMLDIGTGSGCIPLALKKYISEASIHAADVSETALRVAKKNATELKLDITFLLTDILDESKWSSFGLFDVIVSNPPYIKESEAESMHDNVLRHEPHLALFVPDNDPLLFYRKIARFSKEHLQPGGYLFFEINEAHGHDTATMLEELGYSAIKIKCDLQGKERMIRCVHSICE